MAQYVATIPKRTVKGCCCHGHETCSVCDVTCFERPRFFCGQLLTDVELTGEQTYEIDKHRFHNRMLHGTGVVCGLRVQCGPQCDGWVTISSGYALDCRGNDIVVCEPTPFDLIDAIRKYEAKKRGEGCIPPADTPGRKEYCLALVYEEVEANPVTALVRCNGGSTARCEPSRIAEKFRIEVIERSGQQDKVLTWWDKVLACLARVQTHLNTLANVGSYTSVGAAEATVGPAVTGARDVILAAYNELRIRCALPANIRNVQWPIYGAEGATYNQAVFTAASNINSLIFQFFIDCLCEALLLECPECRDLRVIIACVEVENDKILHICNTARRYVMTFPALGYWLAPLLPVAPGSQTHSIAGLLEFLCCHFDLLSHGIQYGGNSTADEAVRKAGAQASYHLNLVSLATKFLRAVPAAGAAGVGPMLGRVLQPEAVLAVAVHNQTRDTAEVLLRKRGYKVQAVRAATAEELPTVMLSGLVRPIPEGATVDLLLGPDQRVVGVVPSAAAAPPEDVTFGAAPGAAPTTAPAAVEELKARIAHLEARLSAMEKRTRRGPRGTAG
jgi:hypothetical protein